jgi:hypothetical protein
MQAGFTLLLACRDERVEVRFSAQVWCSLAERYEGKILLSRRCSTHTNRLIFQCHSAPRCYTRSQCTYPTPAPKSCASHCQAICTRVSAANVTAVALPRPLMPRSATLWRLSFITRQRVAVDDGVTEFDHLGSCYRSQVARAFVHPFVPN